MKSGTTLDPTLEAQAERLSGLAWRLVRTLRAMDATDQACCGVTLSQCYALLSFQEREEMTMAELASRLGMAVSTATRLVDSLVQADLAERRRPDDDRRTVLVRLTRAGHEQVATIGEQRRQRLAQVLQEIPAERREEVLDVLGNLLGALFTETPPCCGSPSTPTWKEKPQ